MKSCANLWFLWYTNNTDGRKLQYGTCRYFRNERQIWRDKKTDIGRSHLINLSDHLYDHDELSNKEELMNVLITGFDPFGGESINPAYEAVKRLPDHIQTANIIKLEIPTVFEECTKLLDEAIQKNHPDLVICVGQAGGRVNITPEFVGINYMDARIPDNKGNQPLQSKIKEDGPDAYFTKLPVKAICEELKSSGIPAVISYSAGTYVCNYVMYSLLYMIDRKYPHIRGGFIHVPYDTSQAAKLSSSTASMPIDMISLGLEKTIKACIEHSEDILIPGGTTH